MRAIHAASVAVLGTVAMVLIPPLPALARPTAAPPALTGRAEERFQGLVTPAVIPAGGRVTLTALGCAGDTTVASPLFGRVTLQKHSGSGTASVSPAARPDGAQRVTFVCADGRVRTRELTVASGGDRGGESGSGGSGAGYDGPARHGVRAGLGGTLGAFDLQQIGVGVALLAGALALAYRRARRHPGGQQTPAESGEQAGRTPG
ncbi:hypothetical protein [Streptomyces sp. TS71-3]|uniref:hypothetical protein n=1 Tax=Streptomyces sp. TS71-3 TaxID=2733862 RepID=UPI001B0E5522|nr:hypothetical protein [Streptomyces sp. TS71-3]GHJ42129.1 hypothetical protein Sm713_77380 [Streptomyces sp. TS71-3]